MAYKGISVVKNGSNKRHYFTVINSNDNSHTHIRQQGKVEVTRKTAKFVARKARMGIIEDFYAYFIKLSIFRLLDKNKQKEYLHMFKDSDIEKYYKGDTA